MAAPWSGRWGPCGGGWAGAWLQQRPGVRDCQIARGWEEDHLLGWVTSISTSVPAAAGCAGRAARAGARGSGRGRRYSACPSRSGAASIVERAGKARQAARLQRSACRHVGWSMPGLVRPASLLPGNLMTPPGSRCRQCAEGAVSEHEPRTQLSTLQHSQRSAHTSQHVASPPQEHSHRGASVWGRLAKGVGRLWKPPEPRSC